MRLGKLDTPNPAARTVFTLSEKLILMLYICLFVCIEAKCPSQQFFSHVGTEPTLPGFNKYCRELMCLAQKHNTVTPVGIEPRTSEWRGPGFDPHRCHRVVSLSKTY